MDSSLLESFHGRIDGPVLSILFGFGLFWENAHLDFLRFYDLIDYGIFYQTWDMNNLSLARKKTLDHVRHCIENEICIVGTDFGKFSG